MMRITLQCVSFILLSVLLLGCQGDDDMSNNDGQQVLERIDPELLEKPIKYIVENYYDKNVFIGIANKIDLKGDMEVDSEGNYGHMSFVIADREFNYVTPSNDFKQTYLCPELDEYRREKTDLWVDHINENNQVLRMHSPISPQCSKWIQDDLPDPTGKNSVENMEKMLDQYMTYLCEQYGSVEGTNANILWMDVVNETIVHNDIKADNLNKAYKSGDWFGPREEVISPSTGKKVYQWQNPWTQLGFDEESKMKVPKYIDMAFELSNRLAPNVKQIINQHGAFEEIVWMDKMKGLVKYLREDKGRRVDGIGWQAHIDCGWEKIPGNTERLDAFIKWAHANNLEFHITELNVWIKDEKNEPPYAGAELEQKEKEQAATYGKVLDILLKNRKTGVVGLNYWNVRDGDTQNGDDRGCLWRDNGTARPGYMTVKEVLIRNRDHDDSSVN